MWPYIASQSLFDLFFFFLGFEYEFVDQSLMSVNLLALSPTFSGIYGMAAPAPAPAPAPAYDKTQEHTACSMGVFFFPFGRLVL